MAAIGEVLDGGPGVGSCDRQNCDESNAWDLSAKANLAQQELTPGDEMAAVVTAIRSALLDEALAFGLKQRLADMRNRLERLEGSASKKRSWASTIMQRFDLAAIKEPDFTASLRPAPPRVIVLAEHQITDEFFKSQPPKLDKKSVLDALKSGIRVPGATLSNQESILSVRTK